MKDKIWLQEMSELVKNKLPEGYGFIVFAFPFDGGRMFYASNGQREDCIKALREWLAQVDGDGQNWLKHDPR